MTRSILAKTTAIAAIIAAPAAFAAGDSMSDLKGNSPAITEGGYATDAGEIAARGDATSKRFSIGTADYDPAMLNVTEEQFNALQRSIGQELRTNDGKMLGMVTDVTTDGMGNPELVVDLNDETKIDADTLVLTLLPDSLELRGGAIFLDTSEDELYLAAQDGSKRDSEGRTAVIVM